MEGPRLKRSRLPFLIGARYCNGFPNIFNFRAIGRVLLVPYVLFISVLFRFLLTQNWHSRLVRPSFFYFNLIDTREAPGSLMVDLTDETKSAGVLRQGGSVPE